MSLSRTIDAMLAAGCTAEQLAAVVRAYEAADAERLAIKRAKDADRQRRSRMSRNVTVTYSDTCDMVSPKKEIPPTPPKEKTTPSVVSEPVGSSTIRSEPDKPAPTSPTVIALPATKNETVAISKADVAEWEEAFPAVDVPQKLKAIRQWLIANPQKRKTSRGMKRFVVAWLTREQDRGVVSRSGAGPPPKETEFARHQRECTEALERRVLGEKRNDEFAGNSPAFDLEPRDWRTH